MPLGISAVEPTRSLLEVRSAFQIRLIHVENGQFRFQISVFFGQIRMPKTQGRRQIRKELGPVFGACEYASFPVGSLKNVRRPDS